MSLFSMFSANKPKEVKTVVTDVFKELVSSFQQLMVARAKFVESETMDRFMSLSLKEGVKGLPEQSPKEQEKEGEKEKEKDKLMTPGSLVDAQWTCGNWFPAYLVSYGTDGCGLVLYEDDRKLFSSPIRPKSNDVKKVSNNAYSSKQNFMDYLQYKILETRIMKMQNEVANAIHYMLSTTKAGDSVFVESNNVAGCYGLHKIKTTGFVNADVTVLRFWSSELMATVTSSFASRDVAVLPNNCLPECSDSDFINAVTFCYRGVTMNPCFVV
jgi:hypothetical protein